MNTRGRSFIRFLGAFVLVSAAPMRLISATVDRARDPKSKMEHLLEMEKLVLSTTDQTSNTAFSFRVSGGLEGSKGDSAGYTLDVRCNGAAVQFVVCDATGLPYCYMDNACWIVQDPRAPSDYFAILKGGKPAMSFTGADGHLDFRLAYAARSTDPPVHVDLRSFLSAAARNSTARFGTSDDVILLEAEKATTEVYMAAAGTSNRFPLAGTKTYDKLGRYVRLDEIRVGTDANELRARVDERVLTAGAVLYRSISAPELRGRSAFPQIGAQEASAATENRRRFKAVLYPEHRGTTRPSTSGGG